MLPSGGEVASQAPGYVHAATINGRCRAVKMIKPV
jgi:hypothetical protein